MDHTDVTDSKNPTLIAENGFIVRIHIQANPREFSESARRPRSPHDAVGYLHEEVGVLEVAEHTEVDYNRCRHPAALHSLILRAGYGVGYQIVAHRRKDQQQEVDSARLIIEEQRERHHIEYAQRSGAAQEDVEREERHEQKQKKPAVENQRSRAVVAKQLFYA